MSDLRRKLLEAKIASFERTGKTSALSGAIEDAELTAEAGVMSNLWNTLFLLSIPRAERELRVHMIGYAKESLQNLRNIELQILNKDLEGAIFAYQEFANNFLGAFVSDFQALMDLENNRLGQKQLPPPKPDERPEAAPDNGIPPSGEGEVEYTEAPPSEPEPFDLAQAKKNLSKSLTELEPKKNSLRSLRPQNDPGMGEVDGRYSRLDSAIQRVKTQEGVNKISKELDGLSALIADLMSKSEQVTSHLIDDDMRKVAQKTVERWIKRKLMNLSPTMRDKMYYKIVQDIVDLDPLLKNINSKLKNRKVHMKDFEDDVRGIVDKIKSVNDRLLKLTKATRASQKKPTIKREVLTNLRELNKALAGAFPKEDEEGDFD
jgi:predicted  nucleic acid-binding Zn-ribbon protein